ncbi:hypothetical protein [Granulicella sp. S156]|uniref:hypothetical protein n=1 Tax=Granulicella sp. S156 TaxID=1747224 RepID=UPI00131ADE80|nr:hypothetical protein [Granulicella sp. S156]
MIGISILTFGLGVATAPAQATGATQAYYSYSNEVYLGGNYMRAASGPTLNDTNFGGWNVSATHFVTPFLGVTADFQGDYGHAPISPSAQLANNPFVYQHLFFLGPQIRWHRSERFSSSLRILVGATDTVSNSDTGRIPPSTFGLYPSATTLSLKPGGTFDLNLSPRVALRLAPGVLLERQGGSFQRDFNVSTGIVFRIGRNN